MGLFLNILTEITLPIIALVALGWAVQPRLKFDIRTLNRLQIYMFLPIFLIHSLSSADIPLREVWPTAWFTVVQFIILTIIGWTIAAALRLPESLRPIIALTVSFPNSGNFGIPLAQLAFPDDYILHQAVIVSLHSILIVTIGYWMLVGQGMSSKALFRSLFQTPLIPSVVLGLLLKGFELPLPNIVAVPMALMSSAFVPLALFALGAQLAGNKSKMDLNTIGISIIFSMILSPVLTWGLTAGFGFTGTLEDLLIVAAAAPVGVLLAVFCAEYKNHGETASAIVFVSTILSPLFASAWILLLRLY